MNSRSIRRLAPAVAMAATAAVLFSACGAPKGTDTSSGAELQHSNTTEAASGPLDEATWMMTKEPVNMDLDNDSSNSHTDIVMGNVCERLMQLSPQLSVDPYLASNFEWKDDHTLVFTLRDDVTFHDGSPMTADDVVWSMKRHMAEGAAESDEFVNVKDVKKTGQHEVTFDMKQPDAVLVEALAGDAGIVLNKKAISKQGKDYGTTAGTDACSGPFELSEWKSGTSVTITKYDDYWNPDRAAQTGKVTFRWGSADSITNALVTGEAQGSYLEDLASAARLDDEEKIQVVQGEDTRVWSLIATERGGLSDPKLRQALSLVIDRQGINEAAFSGMGQPWNEPVGSGAWGFEREKFEAANKKLELSPLEVTDENVEKAKKLVEEVGDTKEIIVATDGDNVRSTLAEAVVSAAEKIGLKASIKRIPPQQYGDFYSDAAARKKVDLFSDDYFVSKYDPVGFYKNGASDSSVQYVFKDKAYDKLVQQGRAATDDAKRADIAIDLAQRWQEAMPWISTTASPNSVAYSTEVTGMPAAGNFRYYPWAADLGAAAEAK